MPTVLMACFALLCAFIQPASAASIDEQIDKYFAPFSDAFSKVVFFSINIGEAKIPFLILLLISASFICTFYLMGI